MKRLSISISISISISNRWFYQMALSAQRGFTLMELIVVMVILVLLAGAVTVTVTKRIEDAKRARAKADISNFETALDLYYADTGTYPTSEQGLRALVEVPNPAPSKWNGPYLRRGVVPPDPWGNEYLYVQPGVHNPDSYDVYSLGRDGREGGVGNDTDIGNWEPTEGR